MTKHIFTTILLGTLLTTGVVSAFQEPGTIFPGGNASAPVHTGGGEQKKSGPFWAQYLKAGLLPFPAAVATANLAGFIIGDKVALAPQGFFTQVFLPGQESQLRVGSSDSGDLYNATFTNRAPVTIDLVGRATGDNDPKGREALALLADGGFCQTSTTIVTNTPAIQLYSDVNNGPADLLARQVQLKGGSPQPGKILISVDRDGNAVWAVPRLVNNQIVFDTSSSPVTDGQNSCTTPPDECPNIAGIQPPGTSCVVETSWWAEPVELADNTAGARGEKCLPWLQAKATGLPNSSYSVADINKIRVRAKYGENWQMSADYMNTEIIPRVDGIIPGMYLETGYCLYKVSSDDKGANPGLGDVCKIVPVNDPVPTHTYFSTDNQTYKTVTLRPGISCVTSGVPVDTFDIELKDYPVRNSNDKKYD